MLKRIRTKIAMTTSETRDTKEVTSMRCNPCSMDGKTLVTIFKRKEKRQPKKRKVSSPLFSTAGKNVSKRILLNIQASPANTILKKENVAKAVVTAFCI